LKNNELKHSSKLEVISTGLHPLLLLADLPAKLDDTHSSAQSENPSLKNGHTKTPYEHRK
jgi:hypothetical protein